MSIVQQNFAGLTDALAFIVKLLTISTCADTFIFDHGGTVRAVALPCSLVEFGGWVTAKTLAIPDVPANTVIFFLKHADVANHRT